MPDRGPYKGQALRILRERGIDVGSILDVGVNRATPELMRIWPDKHHVLFEPVEEFSEDIRTNYRKLSHELHTVAVGKEDGTVALRTKAVLPGQGISHSGMVEGNAAESGMRNVQRVSLDSFVPKIKVPKPYLLKIDIDGLELDVLKGARETLRDCSIVIVECQVNHLCERISLVQDAGFMLFDIVEPCYYDKVLWQFDAILIRDDLVDAAFKRLSGKVEPGMYEMFK